jgi:hypothetical protein
VIHSTSRLAASSAIAVALFASATLTACSSGGSKVQAASTPTASPSASGRGTAGGGRANLFSDPKIKQCLTAAGISIPTRAAGARPSGTARPSFTPGARPSGTAGRGGFGNSAQSAQITAALKACGLSLPSFARPGASPSTTPAT